MTTVLEAINHGLRQCLATSEDVYLLGEDVLDPYGGAFKASRGLSSAFPQRVITTPISEPGFIGVAVGMALRGLRPVVEIMFGDFITLGADQLINHASKMRWMSADEVRVPLVLRTPMGGRRGYGPTHSQSLEKHFLGTPGLRVVAPNPWFSPEQLLINAVLYDDDPVLFIEHKILYSTPVWAAEAGEYKCSLTGGLYPAARIRIAGAPQPALTITAYGYASCLAAEAMRHLAYEHELFAEVIAPTRLSPAATELLMNSASATGAVITVEEAPGEFGWGSEMITALQLAGLRGLRQQRVAAQAMPVPSSGPLEAAVLPQVDDIVAAALETV